jgi:hypothetical protein
MSGKENGSTRPIEFRLGAARVALLETATAGEERDGLWQRFGHEIGFDPLTIEPCDDPDTKIWPNCFKAVPVVGRPTAPVVVESPVIVAHGEAADSLMAAIEAAPDAPAHLGGPVQPNTSTPSDAYLQLREAAEAAYQALHSGEGMTDAEVALRLALDRVEQERLLEGIDVLAIARDAFLLDDRPARPSHAADQISALLGRSERRLRKSAGQLSDATRDLLASIDLNGSAPTNAIADAGIALCRFLLAWDTAASVRAMAGSEVDAREIAELISEAQDLAARLDPSGRVKALESHLTSAWLYAKRLAVGEEGSGS